MEIASKFELHYYLDNGSHQINAFLRNKCEAELLAIISEISVILDIETELVATAAQEGGFREFWDVVKGNANGITVVLLVTQLLLTVTPMLYESEKEELEKKLIRFQIEESQLNIKKLRKEVKEAGPSPVIIKKTVKYLSTNLKIIKRKSNLYAALNKRSEINKIGFSVLDADFIPKTDERQVDKLNFKKHVLNSNKLKAEETETEIEIVSPVLKEGKYKWKGIYNEQPIGFDMLDLSFKDTVLLDNIPFQHGTSIICILRINRELDEVGNVKVSGYAVKTVIEKFDGSTSIVTLQGKEYRQAKKYMESQGTLFT